MPSIAVTAAVSIASVVSGAVLGEALTPMRRLRKRIAKPGEKIEDVGEKIAEVDDGDQK